MCRAPLFSLCLLLFCAVPSFATQCRINFSGVINADDDTVNNAIIYTKIDAPVSTVKPVIVLVGEKNRDNKCLLQELAYGSSLTKTVTAVLVKDNEKAYATIAAVKDALTNNATQWTIGGVGFGADVALRFVGAGSLPKQHSFFAIDGVFSASAPDYSSPDKVFPTTLINSDATIQAQQATKLPLSALKVLFNSTNPGQGDVSDGLDAIITAITSATGVSNIFPPTKRAQAQVQALGSNFVRTASGYYWIKAANASSTALVFIPGAFIDVTAYVETLQQVAAAGFDVFLAPIPYSNAFTEPYVGQLFDKIMQEQAANYAKVSVGGHSLGAYAATVYVKAQRHPKIAGLANISCRCNRAGDISQVASKQLLVYGTHDSLPVSDYLNVQVPLMRNDSMIVEIDGANHSQFGSYDFQKNGVETLATISEQYQHQVVASAIIAHLQSL